MFMSLNERDLTTGDYQDNCDCCGRYEDECNSSLYDLKLSEYIDLIICLDCISKMEKLLSRVAIGSRAS